MDDFADSLLALLRDEDESIVRHAVQDVRSLPGQKVEDALFAVVERVAAEAVDEVLDVLLSRPAWAGEDGRRRLLFRLLPSPRPAVRLRAVVRLGRELRPEDAPELARHLASERDAEVLATLLSSVDGRFAGTEVGARVLPHLESVDARVRANAVEVVERLDLAEGRAQLHPLLQDPSARVRGAAIKALWTTERPRMEAQVREELRSPDIKRKQCAVYLLGVLTDFGEAPRLLAERLRDENVHLRALAARGLRGMAGRLHVPAMVAAYLGEADGAVRAAVAEALGSDLAQRREALDVLLAEGARAPLDAERRANVTRGLGEIGGEDAVPLLEAALKDGDARVRANAVEAIARSTSPLARGLVERMLEDAAPRVCANAAVALHRFGGQEAVPKLIAMLNSKEPRRQACAAFALGEIGTPEVVGPLKEALQALSSRVVVTDEQQNVRDNLARALEKIRGGRAS